MNTILKFIHTNLDNYEEVFNVTDENHLLRIIKTHLNNVREVTIIKSKKEKSNA